jgi:hypothetical protein
MTRSEKRRGREILRNAVGMTGECVPIERFGNLTRIEQAHVAACAHCEAELVLYHRFVANEPASEEGAAVQWIATETARRRAVSQPGPRARWSWFGGRTFAALAAALIMVAGLGSLLIDRQPSIGTPQGDNTYRGTTVRVTQPVGDVARAPEVLQWQPVSGSARYDVVISEVDGTTMWRGTTTDAAVTLPSVVVSRFAPGRAVTWQVAARDASGGVVATSGVQRFKVQPRQ